MKEPAKAESPGMRSGLKRGSEVAERCHLSQEGSRAQAPHLPPVLGFPCAQQVQRQEHAGVLAAFCPTRPQEKMVSEAEVPEQRLRLTQKVFPLAACRQCVQMAHHPPAGQPASIHSIY